MQEAWVESTFKFYPRIKSLDNLQDLKSDSGLSL